MSTRIVGYGPDERVAFERVVPGELVHRARALARVPDDGHVITTPYPLSETAVRELVEVRPRLTYFLEGG